MTEPAANGTPLEPSHEDDIRGPAAWRLPLPVAVTLTAIAAVCLIAGSFSHRWLADPYQSDAGYSLLSYRACSPECSVASIFQVYETYKDSSAAGTGVSHAFPVFGLITFIAALIAVAGLAATLAMVAAGARAELPVSPATIALLGIMLGLISGCVFVATKPGAAALSAVVGVSWSFWIFGIGAIAGIAGVHQLARQIIPADPDLLHDAMEADEF